MEGPRTKSSLASFKGSPRFVPFLIPYLSHQQVAFRGTLFRANGNQHESYRSAQQASGAEPSSMSESESAVLCRLSDFVAISGSIRKAAALQRRQAPRGSGRKAPSLAPPSANRKNRRTAQGRQSKQSGLVWRALRALQQHQSPIPPPKSTAPDGHVPKKKRGS